MYAARRRDKGVTTLFISNNIPQFRIFRDIMYNPTFEEICQRVNIAIGILFKNDIFLLTNGVHERSISHKLAEYLQTLFPDWNVDCEYNRKGDATKILKGLKDCDEYIRTDRVYPDIIIHQRNTKNNLLVIEIKINNTNSECDIEKLKLFTSDPEFKYSYGLFVRFRRINKPDLQWFEEGREKPDNHPV
ncbi:MAG: hypothetical protein ABSB80_09320 [Methanoregula sp.]|jgi:hypothetical protein|uniref:hypothetical protein n=1 Tax=Methanoregula sp. TaxID=2052170 RepID=UPI003D0C9ECD